MNKLEAKQLMNQAYQFTKTCRIENSTGGVCWNFSEMIALERFPDTTYLVVIIDGNAYEDFNDGINYLNYNYGTPPPMPDAENIINKAPHYNTGKYEVIKVIRDWGLGFWLGNAVKYIARAGKKDKSKTIEDLKKALYYINDEIELYKKMDITKTQTIQVIIKADEVVIDWGLSWSLGTAILHLASVTNGSNSVQHSLKMSAEFVEKEIKHLSEKESL